jgi:hypothetical protein
MSFSFLIYLQKVLLPVPSHPSQLVIPKSGFPHALQHGGFSTPVSKGCLLKSSEPAGTFKGFTLNETLNPNRSVLYLGG